MEFGLGAYTSTITLEPQATSYQVSGFNIKDIKSAYDLRVAINLSNVEDGDEISFELLGDNDSTIDSSSTFYYKIENVEISGLLHFPIPEDFYHSHVGISCIAEGETSENTEEVFLDANGAKLPLTNWTDLVLFTEAEISIPPLFGGLPDSYDTNKHDLVKRKIERIIKAKFLGVGKLTETSTDDFDIEQIENGSILKESALEYNLLEIALENLTDIEDSSDKYGNYYSGNIERIDKQLDMDVNQLTWLEPEGINQLTSRSANITR